MVASVRSTSSGALANNASPQITLPATIESGDLILVFYSVDADRALTWDNSSHGVWTQEYGDTGNGFLGSYLYAKVADGTEDGGTLTLTLAVADQSKYVCHAIQDWYGTLADGLDSLLGSGGSTSTPNPPSLNPTPWGTEDTLWFATVHADNNTAVSVWPTNYTSNQVEPNAGLGAITLATASRTAEVESEDPGAYTMTVSRVSMPTTAAVRPAAGGISGTGAANAQDASAAGVGIVTRTGSGTPASQASDVDASGSVGRSGSGVVSAQASVVVGAGTRFATVTLELTVLEGQSLVDANDSPVSNLNDIAWEWYDTPNTSAGNPVDSGTFNTDVLGQATVTVNNSGLADGEFGLLLLFHPSIGTIRANLTVPVAD